MKYTIKTSAYNERRYGKPWLAIVTTSLTKDFEFIDWDGRPGRRYSQDVPAGKMEICGGRAACLLERDGKIPTVVPRGHAVQREVFSRAWGS